MTMKTTLRVLAAALAIPFVAGAQMQMASADHSCCKTAADSVKHAQHMAKKDSAAGSVAIWSLVPQIQIQNFRPADQRGVNVFESPKDAGVPFTGFKLAFGASF